MADGCFYIHTGTQSGAVSDITSEVGLLDTHSHLAERLECLLMWYLLLQQCDAIIDQVHTTVYGIKQVAPTVTEVQ